MFPLKFQYSEKRKSNSKIRYFDSWTKLYM